jgi:hypothetical protein
MKNINNINEYLQELDLMLVSLFKKDSLVSLSNEEIRKRLRLLDNIANTLESLLRIFNSILCITKEKSGTK